MRTYFVRAKRQPVRLVRRVDLTAEIVDADAEQPDRAAAGVGLVEQLQRRGRSRRPASRVGAVVWLRVMVVKSA